MQPHDTYFVLGIFMPLIGIIGILNASAEEYSPRSARLILLIGITLLGVAWYKSPEDFTFIGFIDSVLRMFMTITGV